MASCVSHRLGDDQRRKFSAAAISKHLATPARPTITSTENSSPPSLSGTVKQKPTPEAGISSKKRFSDAVIPSISFKKRKTAVNSSEIAQSSELNAENKGRQSPKRKNNSNAPSKGVGGEVQKNIQPDKAQSTKKEGSGKTGTKTTSLSHLTKKEDTVKNSTTQHKKEKDKIGSAAPQKPDRSKDPTKSPGISNEREKMRLASPGHKREQDSKVKKPASDPTTTLDNLLDKALQAKTPATLDKLLDLAIQAQTPATLDKLLEKAKQAATPAALDKILQKAKKAENIKNTAVEKSNSGQKSNHENITTSAVKNVKEQKHSAISERAVDSHDSTKASSNKEKAQMIQKRKRDENIVPTADFLGFLDTPKKKKKPLPQQTESHDQERKEVRDHEHKEVRNHEREEAQNQARKEVIDSGSTSSTRISKQNYEKVDDYSKKNNKTALSQQGDSTGASSASKKKSVKKAIAAPSKLSKLRAAFAKERAVFKPVTTILSETVHPHTPVSKDNANSSNNQASISDSVTKKIHSKSPNAALKKSPNESRKTKNGQVHKKVVKNNANNFQRKKFIVNSNDETDEDLDDFLVEDEEPQDEAAEYYERNYSSVIRGLFKKRNDGRAPAPKYKWENDFADNGSMVATMGDIDEEEARSAAIGRWEDRLEKQREEERIQEKLLRMKLKMK